jgi:hypothetical protein
MGRHLGEGSGKKYLPLFTTLVKHRFLSELQERDLPPWQAHGWVLGHFPSDYSVLKFGLCFVTACKSGTLVLSPWFYTWTCNVAHKEDHVFSDMH